ncbi:GTPase Era [Parvularcula sp. IMCC14364]|uniref:GTPase Era n=1 Tax=Parvularcula sp. IMCC14364 TaxID=3067902 RepID=UPI002741F435|nr:GTPase Era [Parvularcula sp. IMCC14364]
MTSTDFDNRKCAFVAVIGAPNAGKSTFVNHMVGAKVSIVTHKVQTTRTSIRGVALSGKAQLIFVDTPGIFKPRRRLDEAMVSAAWEGADDVDFRLLLVDARAYDAVLRNAEPSRADVKAAEDTDLIIENLKQGNQKVILVLNKIDLLPAENLLPLVQHFSDTGLFEETFMISAEKARGTDAVMTFLTENAPQGVWLYPEDQLSDISDRLMAAEITREKLFLRMHQELPYSLTVETESWTRTKKKELRIEQVIYVERDGQKALVLGQGGKSIKYIGQTAREEMETLFGEKVHLFLFVKVRENWTDSKARLHEMGLTLTT